MYMCAQVCVCVSVCVCVCVIIPCQDRFGSGEAASENDTDLSDHNFN